MSGGDWNHIQTQTSHQYELMSRVHKVEEDYVAPNVVHRRDVSQAVLRDGLTAGRWPELTLVDVKSQAQISQSGAGEKLRCLLSATFILDMDHAVKVRSVSALR